jgi:hypothetical protein
MVVAEWHVGEVFWAMLWFSLLLLWVWVVITVFVDVFRSRDTLLVATTEPRSEIAA